LKRYRIIVAYTIGLLGYAGGLLMSVWLDLPTGAAIVWSMAILGAIWMLIGRGK